MTSTDKKNRSSADVEREVEFRRASLRSTLDELRDRVTPGQMLDEVWQFARGSGGGSFVKNFGRSVRDNPLPVGLIGAGIAWLMTGRSGGLPRVSRSGEDFFEEREYYPTESRDYSRPRRAYDQGISDPLTSLDADREADRDEADTEADTSGGDGFASGLVDRARAAMGSVQDAASGAGESISDGAGRAAGGLSEARDTASEYASAMGRGISRRSRRLGRSAMRTGRNARERALGIVEEQPIALALAGIVLGAALGAAFRTTAAEAELMGETADRVKDEAKRMAEDGVDEASAALGRTFDAVKEEAKEQGLTTEDAADAADSMSARLRKVAERGKAALKEEIGAGTEPASGTSGSTSSEGTQAL